LFFFFF